MPLIRQCGVKLATLLKNIKLEALVKIYGPNNTLNIHAQLIT